MKKILPFTLVFFLSACSIPKNGLIEEPMHDSNDSYAKHFAYSFLYNEKNEQADWVAYQLLASELEPNYKRTNKFLEDSLVLTATANNTDYKKSGYDKGHLAPAADMTWNEKAMKESFYFSNISPQLAGFNRGIWKKLEGKVRKWAKTYHCVYVTTGPICNNPEQSIGQNDVVVPNHFYKTVLVYNDTIKQSIAFLFPHKKCEGDLFDYAVSVDSLELITGIDFYYLLPNSQEENIEMQYDLDYWNK